MGCFFSQPYTLLGRLCVNAQELKTLEWIFWYHTATKALTTALKCNDYVC